MFRPSHKAYHKINIVENTIVFLAEIKKIEGRLKFKLRKLQQLHILSKKCKQGLTFLSDQDRVEDKIS